MKGLRIIMEFFKKWYVYQKERFPVLVYGLYCFCVVFGVFCYVSGMGYLKYREYFNNPNSYLMGAPAPFVIEWKALVPMFIVGFLQFLMVRIVDEFKDYEEDCKYRPYRPVPRGLVTLKELKILFIICAILQVIITLYINPILIFRLAVVWIFFAVMSKGFFIKKFLDKHILIEVTLDELLLPISALYLSHFIIFVNSNMTIADPGNGFYFNLSLYEFFPLVLMTYVISWIVEVARKIRCKEDEEEGVRTYTAVFGIFRASLLLFALESVLFGIVSWIIGVKVYIAVAFVVTCVLNLLFMIKKNKVMSKCLEYFSDFYVMMCLVSLIWLIL